MVFSFFTAVKLPAAAEAAEGKLKVTFSDVKDTGYFEPVKKLASLGILNGYPDGTFKPDGDITRAEFAAAVVRALGLGDNAELVKKNTKFKDVQATHWASGYINIASDQGIIKGYEDGTFKPDNKVTYNEAITMLVRMLGYEPAVVGEFPAGYVAKAREIGVTDDVKIKGEFAPRGDVAIMLANSMTIDLMEQSKYGDDNVIEEIKGKNLLNKIYDITEVEGVVSKTPRVSEGTLAEDEMEFIATEDIDNEYDDNTYEDGDTYEVTVMQDIDIDEYLGYEVILWVNDDDEVINVELDTDPEDIVYDEIDDLDIDAKEVLLDDSEDTYDLAWDKEDDKFAGVAYYNGAAVDIKDLDDEDKEAALENLYEAAKVKLVLNDDDEVIFIDAWDYYNNNWYETDHILVVDEVDLENEEIEGFDSAGGTVKLELDDVDYVIKKDGKVINLEDINEDDVLYVFVAPDEKNYTSTPVDDDDIDFYYIELYDQKVEGVLEKVKAYSPDIWDYMIVVDGEEYWLDGYTTYILDEDDDPEYINKDDEIDDNLEDLTGEEVTLFLDYEGCVRHIEAKDAVASGDSDEIVAIVTDAPWRSTGADRNVYFEVLNPDDDEVVYELTDDTEFEGLTGPAGSLEPDEGDLDNGDFDPDETYVFDMDQLSSDQIEDLANIIAVGTPVRLTLDKDGAVELLEVLAAGDVTDGFYVPIDDKDIVIGRITDYDTDDDTVKVGSTWAVKAGSTVVYDQRDKEVKSWDEFEGVLGDLDDEDAPEVILVRDGSKVDYLIVLSDYYDADLDYKSDTDVAMVIDRFYEDGNWYLVIDEYGKQNTYEVSARESSIIAWVDDNVTVSGSVYATTGIKNINRGDIIEYALSSGELSEIIEHRAIEGRVARNGVDVDDKTIEIDEVVVLDDDNRFDKVMDTDDAMDQGKIAYYFYNKETNKLEAKELPTDEFIIDEDTVVYDFTSWRGLKKVDFKDIKGGDKVHLIDFNDDQLLEAIVIVKEYDFE
jgi:hypothetical protein